MSRNKKFTLILVFFAALIIAVIIMIDTNWNLVVSKRDIITIIKDVVSAIAILIGGFFAYFKFFKGRTFAPKAEVNIELQLIETPANSILHVIKIHFINKGSTTIWNPTATTGIHRFSKVKEFDYELIHGLKEVSFFEDGGKITSYMIDPGEKNYFSLNHEYDKSIWAVSYDVQVTSKDGTTWKDSITVANSVRSK